VLESAALVARNFDLEILRERYVLSPPPQRKKKKKKM
jgi:hypothetical protein